MAKPLVIPLNIDFGFKTEDLTLFNTKGKRVDVWFGETKEKTFIWRGEEVKIPSLKWLQIDSVYHTIPDFRREQDSYDFWFYVSEESKNWYETQLYKFLGEIADKGNDEGYNVHVPLEINLEYSLSSKIEVNIFSLGFKSLKHNPTYRNDVSAASFPGIVLNSYRVPENGRLMLNPSSEGNFKTTMPITRLSEHSLKGPYYLKYQYKAKFIVVPGKTDDGKNRYQCIARIPEKLNDDFNANERLSISFAKGTYNSYGSGGLLYFPNDLIVGKKD